MNGINSVPAPKPVIGRLRKRQDFVALRKGNRAHSSSFVLQMKHRTPHDENPTRVGFTITKKVGNAVMRNRIKRRLRAAVSAVFGSMKLHGNDVVVIGKRHAMQENFEALCSQLEACAKKTNYKSRPDVGRAI